MVFDGGCWRSYGEARGGDVDAVIRGGWNYTREKMQRKKDLPF